MPKLVRNIELSACALIQQYMKNRLQPLFIPCLLILISTFFLSCEKDPDYTLSGEWRLVAFEESYTDEILLEPEHIPRSIILNFNDKGKNGTIEGHTVTNEIIGDYILYNGLEMKVNDFGGTLKGEPQWGENFWENIHKVGMYIRSNNALYLYYRGDSSRMVFTRN